MVAAAGVADGSGLRNRPNSPRKENCSGSLLRGVAYGFLLVPEVVQGFL